MYFMARFALIILIIVAVCSLICGFHPEKMTSIGWILLAVCAMYGLLSVFLPERMLKRRLNRRKTLSFDEIYNANFQQLQCSRQSVEETWNEVARDFGIDAGKLRPSDRFGVELSVKGFPLVDLSEAVNDRLDKRLQMSRASSDEVAKTSSIKTLFDYVEFVCRVESRQQHNV
jgi:hypothetical protein